MSEARILAAYRIVFGSSRYRDFNLPDPQAGWLTLAMSSTLAGNLTITGSIANIMVVERAAAEGVQVGSAITSGLVCR